MRRTTRNHTSVPARRGRRTHGLVPVAGCARSYCFYTASEPEEVMRYRGEIFIPHLDALRPHLVENKSPDEQMMKDYLGQKKHVLVFHDECVFDANDGSNWSWVFEGRHKLRPKGEGRGIVNEREFQLERDGFNARLWNEIVSSPNTRNS